MHPTVDLGPDSLLSAAGVLELTPNNYNLRTGSVLSGGTVSISGNIVAEAGAVVDVSGASGVLSLPSAAGSSGLMTAGYVPTTVDSNGGTISLKGGSELFTDATLLGGAGGVGAVGGHVDRHIGPANPAVWRGRQSA